VHQIPVTVLTGYLRAGNSRRMEPAAATSRRESWVRTRPAAATPRAKVGHAPGAGRKTLPPPVPQCAFKHPRDDIRRTAGPDQDRLEAWTGIALAFYTDWPSSFWITALSAGIYLPTTLPSVGRAR
jgi:hypothetical protein